MDAVEYSGVCVYGDATVECRAVPVGSAVGIVECDVSAEYVAAVYDGGSVDDDVYGTADKEASVDTRGGTNSDVGDAVGDP